MHLSEIAGTSLGEHVVEYDERTTILYALCCGATQDDLELVWEERLVALPTLATALGLWAVEAAGGLGAYDRSRSLHVGQVLDIHAPLPPSGSLAMRGSVGSVYDKGKAAIVEIVATSEAFTAVYTIFLPGLGGFGGDRGPASAPAEAWTAHDERTVPTAPNLALLYRLTGDHHPIHVDPDLARANGFDRPILHGLCTLGIATLAATRAAGRRPDELTRLSARLGAAVRPGDDIRVRTADERADTVAFEAAVGTDAVVRDGALTFAGRP